MGNNTDNQIDVAIIGAGMAGLSAAVHVRHSGLSVKVFEQHYLPGGLCTAWKRSGYTFDYCIDYLKQFEDLKNTSKA
jgi:phytoene dehydrogenase-like protein